LIIIKKTKIGVGTNAHRYRDVVETVRLKNVLNQYSFLSENNSSIFHFETPEDKKKKQPKYF